MKNLILTIAVLFGFSAQAYIVANDYTATVTIDGKDQNLNIYKRHMGDNRGPYSDYDTATLGDLNFQLSPFESFEPFFLDFKGKDYALFILRFSFAEGELQRKNVDMARYGQLAESLGQIKAALVNGQAMSNPDTKAMFHDVKAMGDLQCPAASNALAILTRKEVPLHDRVDYVACFVINDVAP